MLSVIHKTFTIQPFIPLQNKMRCGQFGKEKNPRLSSVHKNSKENNEENLKERKKERKKPKSLSCLDVKENIKKNIFLRYVWFMEILRI